MNHVIECAKLKSKMISFSVFNGISFIENQIFKQWSFFKRFDEKMPAVCFCRKKRQVSEGERVRGRVLHFKRTSIRYFLATNSVNYAFILIQGKNGLVRAPRSHIKPIGRFLSISSPLCCAKTVSCAQLTRNLC